MLSTVKECGRSLHNLQFDSGYPDPFRLVVRNCLVKRKALESRKWFQPPPPQVRCVSSMPNDPNEKSVAAPKLMFQKPGFIVYSQVFSGSVVELVKLGLWNWLFEPGPVAVQDTRILLTCGERPHVLA